MIVCVNQPLPENRNMRQCRLVFPLVYFRTRSKGVTAYIHCLTGSSRLLNMPVSTCTGLVTRDLPSSRYFPRPTYFAMYTVTSSVQRQHRHGLQPPSTGAINVSGYPSIDAARYWVVAMCSFEYGVPVPAF